MSEPATEKVNTIGREVDENNTRFDKLVKSLSLGYFLMAFYTDF